MGGNQVSDIALATIQAKGTDAFYMGDMSPALRTPSGLYRGYKDFANTPALVTTDTLALVSDLSEGAAIGAELGDGSALDKRPATDGTVTRDAGVINFENAAAGLSTAISEEITGLTVGKLYRFAGRLRKVSGGDPVMTIRTSSGGGGSTLINGNTVSATEFTDRFVYWIATQTSVHISYLAANSSVFEVVEVSHSFKAVAGNHFFQSTSADEPTLTFADGQWGVVGDGVSKGFDNGLAPNANPTLLTAFEANAVSDIITGCQVGTNKFELGLNGDGKLIANIGTTVAVVTAASIVGVPGVAALSASGSDYFAGWYPIAGGSETDTGTFSGSIPTTQGVYSLQTNDDGSGASFADATMWRNLMQLSQWSQAQIEAVAANDWRSRLGSLVA